MAGIDLNVAEHWYKAVLAAGVALGIAAVAAGHTPLLIVALGLVFWGAGEFMNHPFRSGIVYNEYGGISGTVSGHPRRPKPLGIALDILGWALILWGLFRALTSA